MPNQKATHRQTKQHNQDLVLRTIFDHDYISRADIARITKLTRATVSDLVANLIEEGLVEEVGYGESSGGKNPILLVLVADSRYLIGLNMAQDRFIGSIVNLRGEIKETVEIPFNMGGDDQALNNVYQILDELTRKQWKPVVGIGVGTPGLVNTRDGMVVDAVNLNWRNFPLAKLLEGRYNIPVMVLNDSQATAIGEFVNSGKFHSDENAIVVNIKHGIGAGILINGRLFQGDGGAAGEIGHIQVDADGPVCRCGRKGCLETVASSRAVVQKAQSLLPEYPNSVLNSPEPTLTFDMLEKAFCTHDPLAEKVIFEAARALGKSMAGLVGTLNIRKIVLSGYMTRFGTPWLNEIDLALQQSSLAQMAGMTRFEIGELGFKACILGCAALMVLDDYSLLYKSRA
jgi:predicted NBD/HSP70 family sugar kinase